MTDALLQTYQNNAVIHFHRQALDFISVSLDGTRLGKREVLLTALCAPETGGTFWCPPRAESLDSLPPKPAQELSEKDISDLRKGTPKNV